MAETWVTIYHEDGQVETWRSTDADLVARVPRNADKSTLNVIHDCTIGVDSAADGGAHAPRSDAEQAMFDSCRANRDQKTDAIHAACMSWPKDPERNPEADFKIGEHVRFVGSRTRGTVDQYTSGGNFIVVTLDKELERTVERDEIELAYKPGDLVTLSSLPDCPWEVVEYLGDFEGGRYECRCQSEPAGKTMRAFLAREMHDSTYKFPIGCYVRPTDYSVFPSEVCVVEEYAGIFGERVAKVRKNKNDGFWFVPESQIEHAWSQGAPVLFRYTEDAERPGQVWLNGVVAERFGHSRYTIIRDDVKETHGKFIHREACHIRDRRDTMRAINQREEPGT